MNAETTMPPPSPRGSRCIARLAAALALAVLALTVLAAASSGARAQTIYAVVLGNQKFVVGSSTLHSGLFATRDSGRSWTHLGTENLKAYAMDAVDSSRGRILYIAAGNGVHRSTDYGATWRIMTDWRMSEVMDVRVDQRDPRNVYAATAFGFWLSMDSGYTWENPPGPIQKAYTYRVDTLAGRIVVSGESALYVSSDHGRHWRRSDPIPAPRGVYTIEGQRTAASAIGPLALAVGPDDSTSAFAMYPRGPRMNVFAMASAGHSAYVAGDSGVWHAQMAAMEPRWLDITGSLPNRTVHALAVAGNVILAGTFGDGVYRRVDGAWVRSGLDGSQVWSMRVKGY
jgi:hypothetical protein